MGKYVAMVKLKVGIKLLLFSMSESLVFLVSLLFVAIYVRDQFLLVFKPGTCLHGFLKSWMYVYVSVCPPRGHK